MSEETKQPECKCHCDTIGGVLAVLIVFFLITVAVTLWGMHLHDKVGDLETQLVHQSELHRVEDDYGDSADRNRELEKTVREQMQKIDLLNMQLTQAKLTIEDYEKKEGQLIDPNDLPPCPE